jgi:hypothetical protein
MNQPWWVCAWPCSWASSVGVGGMTWIETSGSIWGSFGGSKCKTCGLGRNMIRLIGFTRRWILFLKNE